MKVKSIIDLGAFGRHEIILSPGAEEAIRVGQEVTGRIILVAIAESEDEIQKSDDAGSQPGADILRTDLCRLHDDIFEHFNTDTAVLLINNDFTGTNGTAAKQYLRPDLLTYLEVAVKDHTPTDERKAVSRTEIDGRLFERIDDGKVRWFAVRKAINAIRNPRVEEILIAAHADITNAFRGKLKPKKGVTLVRGDMPYIPSQSHVVARLVFDALEEMIKGRVPVFEVEDAQGFYGYPVSIDGKVAFHKTVGRNETDVWRAIL